MRKLGSNRDSLELLLDTVCSMFGAILLIAILVALMAQTDPGDESGERASAEILQRKIATAEADLAETRRLIAQIGTPSSTAAANLAAEKRRLTDALAQARAEGERVRSQLQDHIARQTVDYSAEWKKLLAEQRELERQEADLANSIKTQDKNTTRLDSRAGDIGRAIQDEKKSHVVNLRFPKERARTKRSLPVICKFGKIYPLLWADGKKNETTVLWSTKGLGQLARPVEAGGWTISENKSALDDLFKAVPKDDVYISFFVYPDSFDAYHAARDLVLSAKLDFGLEFSRTGSDLVWGSSGSPPPPPQ